MGKVLYSVFNGFNRLPGKVLHEKERAVLQTLLRMNNKMSDVQWHDNRKVPSRLASSIVEKHNSGKDWMTELRDYALKVSGGSNEQLSDDALEKLDDTIKK